MAIWRIRATVDDRPGYLAVLTASLALRSVNILSVLVHASEAGAVDDFLVDAPDALTERDLAEAVEKGRGRDTWVAKAEARGLVDEPTRVLGLAAKVATDPASLEEALVALLGPCRVTRVATARAAGDGLTPSELSLADPEGGTLLVRREAPAFTPAEYARAQALVAVAGVVAEDGDGRAALGLGGDAGRSSGCAG